MSDSPEQRDTTSDPEPTLEQALAANVAMRAELEQVQDALTTARQAVERAQQVSPTPTYPDTRYLVLCTFEGRKSGRVTVGESRLPAELVLTVLHLHGLGEARLQWPQLAGDELAVLEQLNADLKERAADRALIDTEAAEPAESTAHNPWRVELCWVPGQNGGRVSVYPSRSPVHAIWGQLAAGEDPGAVADDYHLTPGGAKVLDRLRREVYDPDPEGNDGYSRAILRLQAEVDSLVHERDCSTHPTRTEVEAAVVHDGHCLAYGQLVIPGKPCGCTVAEVLNELVAHGWLQLAEEPGDG